MADYDDDPAFNECDAVLAILLDDNYDAMVLALRDDPASLYEVIITTPVLPLMDAFSTLIEAFPERHDDMRNFLHIRISSLTTTYNDPLLCAHDLSTLNDLYARLRSS